MRIWLFLSFSLLSYSQLSYSQVSSRIDFERGSEFEKEIAKECWSMPADSAAMMIANEFKSKGETIKVEKKIKLIQSGYITHSGSSNGIGSQNTMIKFGDHPVQYHVYFRKGHMGYSKMAYAKNMAEFSCTKSAVSKETSHACKIVQYFRGMVKVTESGSSINRYMIYSTPTSIYDFVQVYGSKGKRILWQQDKLEKEDVIEDGYSWISNYGEAVLNKSSAFKTASITKVSSKPSQRAELVLLVREILRDNTIPAEFALTIVEGVNMACLTELKEDLISLSRRVPAVSVYMKKLKVMEAARRSRDWLELMDSKEKEDVLYHQLRERFHKDKDQQLRREVDRALMGLNAVGSEAHIAKMIDMKESVKHLVYDMAFKNREACGRLMLRELTGVTTVYEHYRLISDLLKLGKREMLMKYLEGASDQKFSQCCHHMVSEIRQFRPSWQLKLQKGLISYVKESKDEGEWVLQAMKNLIPTDNPRYFDLKAVGECLTAPAVKRKIMARKYPTNPADYDLLVTKWEKLQ